MYMRINCVARVNANVGRNVAFQRKLREDEKSDYSNAINQALDYLGVINRAMVIHGPSFPAHGQIEQNVGSPYESEEFLNFIKLHGFNSVQLGPTGKLNDGDNSPYVSSVFAKNPLSIDFSLLTTPEYASLLTEEELMNYFNSPVETEENYTRANYGEAKKVSNLVLEKAYHSFLDKLSQEDKDAKRLNKEFKTFQRKNAEWLNYYAVLDVIAKKYGTDNFLEWDNKDRFLIKKIEAGDIEAKDYYRKINKENRQQIEFYKFSQFLIDKQSNADDSNRGLTYISDLLIGASKFDELIFEDVFLKRYKLGVEEGGPFNSPQLWGISLLDPNKLFNKDGSLGEAGKYLKLKLNKALQNAENIRIDHALGLVDPYIYDESTVVYAQKRDKNGDMVRYPVKEKLRASYLSKTGIDKNKNYLRIIPDIVLPLLKEKGIDKDDVVWEDLGCDATGLFNKVFKKENHLSGISRLDWSRGENTPKENWAYIGCHDDMPVRELVKTAGIKDSDAWNLDYLAGYLNPSPKRSKEREVFKKKITNSRKEKVKAKFADLFRSARNIQISFMDFFGIDKRYNTPGTMSDKNWTLRVNPNYEDTYYNNLQKNDYAMNMPEILSIAVQAKSDMDFAKGEKTEYQAKREAEPILRKLSYYDKVLKEKE